MGNCGLAVHPSLRKQVVKLVHSNGLVEEFYRIVKAGELLIDYPQHFICHEEGLVQLIVRSSDGLLASVLSAEDDMDIGQVYFLLPKSMLQAAPSKNDITALLSKASAATKESYKDSMIGPLPLPARNGTCGHGHSATCEEKDEDDDARAFLRRLFQEAKQEMEKRAAADPVLGRSLNKSAELQSAFANAMLARTCSRIWRPPLDTIHEEENSIAHLDIERM